MLIHILYYMEERAIFFPKDERIRIYLKSILAKNGVTFQEAEEKDHLIVRATIDEKTYFHMVLGCLENFFKTKIICSCIPKASFDKMGFYALVGAVKSIDEDKDIEKIKRVLPRSSICNLEGLVRFGKESLYLDWLNLGSMTAKLYSQCNNEDDVFALCIFMLGIHEGAGNNLYIDTEGHLYKKKDGNNAGIDVVRVFDDDDHDFIYTVTGSQPYDVVVSAPEKISPVVLFAIRSLGRIGQ